MLFLFVPYYNEPTKEFLESIENSTVKFGGDTYANRLIYRDRKRAGIYWTKSVNDFYDYVKSCRGVNPSDVVAICNSDISFNSDLIEEGMKVKEGEVYIPEGIRIDWSEKSFLTSDYMADTFAGRCFFMTYGDFKRSGGFSKFLPHYLSDYDFGIKMLKKLRPVIMTNKIKHSHHSQVTGFNMISVNNPIFWTMFLLRHFNLYTLINIGKAWYDALFRH